MGVGPLGRGPPYLPGDDQLRLAASSATDVSRGDFRDCSGDEKGVMSGAKANEGPGGGRPGGGDSIQAHSRVHTHPSFEIRNPKAPTPTRERCDPRTALLAPVPLQQGTGVMGPLSPCWAPSPEA